MEILRVQNLVKTYGKGENEVRAVDDISFSIEKGELVAIVGASGKDIYSLSNDNLAIFRRRQIGIIYQFYNLIPILNVKENITLPCDLDGQNVDKERLDNLLKTLGLENRANHLPNELSRWTTTKSIYW